MKRLIVGFSAVLAVLIGAAGQARANLVVNGSFESPVVSGFQYRPTSSDWVYNDFIGSGGSGLATASSGFNLNGPVPDGTQFAFIQDVGNYIEQTVMLPSASNYQLSYYAGGRLSVGGETSYNVYLGASLIDSGTTTSGAMMTLRTSYFVAPAGAQTLRIQIANTPYRDNTAYFDNIVVSPVPEPSTIVLLGMGAVGLLVFAWRWRKRMA